jgi:hypothetical protein
MVALHYDMNDNKRHDSNSLVLSDLYPDPKSLPSPSMLREPIPSVNLSQLEPGKYVSTTARIAFLRTAERHDALGEKVVFTGVLEDTAGKVSFVSHKIAFPLIRDSVYNINSAYVHEFPDRSLLLVITEFTKLESKNVEDIREYTWVPKISDIKRPLVELIEKARFSYLPLKLASKYRMLRLIDNRITYELLRRDFVIPNKRIFYLIVKTVKKF